MLRPYIFIVGRDNIYNFDSTKFEMIRQGEKLMILRRFSTVLALGLLVGGCERLPKILGSDLSSEEVSKTAKEITVIIDGCGAAGSGVVFKKDDKTYSVLTAYHVLKKAKGNCLILTSDGSQYKVAASDATVPVAGVDLAVFTFVSEKTYKLAKMGDSDKAVEGTTVYVAGAAGISEQIKQRTMLIPAGKIIGFVPQPSEVEGYGLIYDNKTSGGMSGGPVLNQKGELIGIHGSGDRQDGMDAGRKFGIPIKIFLKLDSGATKGNQSNDATAYYSQGLARSNQEDVKGAIADFSKAISLNPQYAYAYLNRGVEYYYLGDKKKAFADFDEAIKIDPNYALAYKNRGNVRDDKEMKDYQGAIADYDQAIKINPNLADAYLSRGGAYYELGDKKKAIADYDQAIKINPNFADAYYGRGRVYYDLGEKQKAIADYDQAIKINPNHAFAYQNRGLAYSDLGNKDQALADYNQSIKIDSNDAIAYNGRGAVNDKLGEKQKAIADYDQAIKLDSNYAIAYHNRGTAYYILGEKQKAIADYDQAIKLNPNYADAYVGRGNVYYVQGENTKALNDYSKAIELNPNYAIAYYNRAFVYRVQGGKTKAINDYTKAIELDSNYANAYYNRGKAYSDIENKESAIQDYQKAADLYKQQGKTSDEQDAVNQVKKLSEQ
jgi:tetratricopeptide (TPR) repeat protein